MKNLLLILTIGMLFPLAIAAQRSGYINRPATSAAGRTVLDPNGDGYTSATTAGFNSNDVANSEIAFATVPAFSLEPFGDLRRGPDHLYSDFVPDQNGDGVYMTYRGTNLIFRFRMGTVMPGSKGYSIMIDTDGKFGPTGPYADPNYQPATTGVNGNPGFEIEVVMETNFRVAIYNVDGSSSPTLIKSYTAWQDISQVSVAGTMDNGDPDFFLDFYIPFSDLQASPFNLTTSTPLRFCATTVMSPQAAIGGPKSDIYGLNDDDFKNTNEQYELYIKGQPSVTVSTLNTGFTDLCTEAPVLNAPISTGTVTITGTWTKSSLAAAQSIATITVYKNGSTVLGTVSNVSSGSTWSLPNVTLVAGDIITAKAKAAQESMCLSSNSEVASVCNATNKPATPVLDCYTTTKGISGTNLSNGWTIYIENTTRGTSENSTTNASALFSAPTGTSPNKAWMFSNGCSSGSPLTSGSYKVYYRNDVTGCVSEPAYVCVAGNGGTALAGTVAVPVITSPANNALLTSTKIISGTATASSTLNLYVDGILSKTTTANASGTFSFSDLNFKAGQQVHIVSERNTGTVSTSYCAAQTAKFTVTCFTRPALIDADGNNETAAGLPITGTTSAPGGSTVRVYNSSNTLLATTTVQSNGTWSTANAGTTPSIYNAVAGTVYYAVAQAGTCGVSAASANITATGPTSASRCGTITGPVVAGATSVSGTVSGAISSTQVILYQDGVAVGNTTTSTTGWTITLSSSVLQVKGVLTIGIRESGKREVSCAATVTVGCSSNPPTPSLSQSNYSINQNQTVTYTITNATSGYFYGIIDATSGDPLGNSWATSTGSLNITTPTFSSTGTYDVLVKTTSLTGVDVCTSTPTSSRIVVNAALPVKFLDFTATNQNGNAHLQWKVAEESNVDQYQVEQSTDGRQYQVVGRVGYDASLRGSYQYTTGISTSNISYYRIRQVDLDGKFMFSKVISVRKNEESISLNVNPNPVQQTAAALIRSEFAAKGTLMLSDLSGKNIFIQSVSIKKGINTIDLPQINRLEKGLYMIRFNYDGKSIIQKLVKL